MGLLQELRERTQLLPATAGSILSKERLPLFPCAGCSIQSPPTNQMLEWWMGPMRMTHAHRHSSLLRCSCPLVVCSSVRYGRYRGHTDFASSKPRS